MPSEIRKLNEAGFVFVKLCMDANAETLKHTLTGVTYVDKEIGDWQIVVKRIKHPDFKCVTCEDTGIITKTEWTGTDDSFDVDYPCPDCNHND